MNDPWPAVACVSAGALVFCYYWLLDVRKQLEKVNDAFEFYRGFNGSVRCAISDIDAKLDKLLAPKKQPEKPEHYHIEVYETSENGWGWNVFYHATDKTGSYAMRWDAEAKGFKTTGYDVPAHAFVDACCALKALQDEDAKYYTEEQEDAD
jgi:hypothetical protein